MKKFKKIQAAAFDMDGLIFDTEALSKQAFFLAADQFQLQVEPDYYKRFIGHSQHACDQLMHERFGADFDTAGFRFLWWSYVCAIFEEQGVEFKPGFHELFDTLETNNLPLVLVTTSSHSSVLRNFKGWNYPDRFDVIITADRGLPAKPAPDKYLQAAKDVGVSPQSMMVIEDSNIGMQAAISAGCKSVMVPDLVEPSDHVKSAAYKIFPNLYHLNDWYMVNGELCHD